MGLSHVPMAIRPHGPKLRFETARTEINQVMAKDWTGANGKTSPMMYSPDFFASERFIGHSPLRPRRDQLRFAALLQQQRRAEGFLQLTAGASQRRALRFPKRLTRVLVQGRDILCVAPVPDQKEPVTPKYRRTARADLVIQFQSLLPNYFSA